MRHSFTPFPRVKMENVVWVVQQIRTEVGNQVNAFKVAHHTRTLGCRRRIFLIDHRRS